jgi:hypothetical protein
MRLNTRCKTFNLGNGMAVEASFLFSRPKDGIFAGEAMSAGPLYSL